jgi:hypothetical protein
MLPSKRRLFVPLMVALLDSQQLYTVVMPRGDADHTVGSFHNFSCDVRVQDIKSGSSLEDFNWWSIFATENPGEVHAGLFKIWENVHDLRCDALTSSDPMLFRVTTREYETDVLDLLSEIVNKELGRHSFGYVIERYRLARK